VLSPYEQAQLQARIEMLAPVHSFYISGRLAVTASDNAWNGSLRWEQRPASYIINFNSPTGQGALQLAGNNEEVVLKLANGETQHADDPETLLYNQTGLDFPLHGLRYWVTGLPQPDEESLQSLQLDTEGRITTMRQSGWTINYTRFQTVNGLTMPRKMDMQNNNLTIRLLIDRWQLDTGTGS
jgi:outer membrane lipoprotein LolB